MKDKKVDLVLTCIDDNAALALGKELRKQNLDAIQYLPNGYDAELAKANGEFLEGDIVGVPFAPFETKPKPPGLVEFNKWMDKAGYDKNELAMAGWLSAAMFYEGLQGAGPNFTRQKVIDALNKKTDQTLDGLIPPRELDRRSRHQPQPGLHGVRQGRERQVRPDVHEARQAVHVPARPAGEAADEGDFPVTHPASRP